MLYIYHYMDKGRVIILIGLLSGILAINTVAFAQLSDPRMQLFSIESGLTQTYVTALFQDSRGFLWIGTEDGLNRYEGSRFRNYRNRHDDTSSICNNYIRAICEDFNANIWIATNYGLSMYSRVSGRFKNFYHDPENSNSLSSNKIYNVMCDREGYIWVKTNESLEKFSFERNIFISYKHYLDVFNYSSEVLRYPLCQDFKGDIWVGTKDGLNRFDIQKEVFERFEHNATNKTSISNNSINELFQDKGKNLWIGTANGLCLFNRLNNDFTRISGYADDGGVNDNNILSITENASGELMIGKVLGFDLYHPVKNEIQKYQYINYRNVSYGLTSVNSLLLDVNNILWIGSKQGLTKIDQKDFKFDLNSVDYLNFELNNQAVYALWLDGDELWLGTDSKGIIIINRRNNNIRKYNTYTSTHKLINNSVYVIKEDRKNRVWIGTESGLNIYDKRTNQISIINEKGEGRKSYFDKNRIFSICHTQANVTYIGTRQGLFLIDSSRIERLPILKADGIDYTINQVFTVVENKMGYLWIGTDQGLFYYNPVIKTAQIFSSWKANVNEKISNNYVYSLLIDSDDVLWIGTASGLNSYSFDENKIVTYTVENGLPNDVIYSIIEDDMGNLWVSTNYGLVRFDKASLSFTSFDLADGLQGYEFNINAVHKSFEGELFFGGINGYNSFFPEAVKYNLKIPNIEITSFELFNKGGNKKMYVANGSVVIIPADNNLINVEFAALDFTYPEKNNYSYQLSRIGESSEWVALGTRNMATFSNLQQGEYLLKIRGSNSDNIWNEEGIVISLKVMGPFYTSIVAYIVYFISFVLIVYLWFLFRTRKLRKSNKILREKELASIEVEKQKELLTIKNKNITDSINYAKRIQEALMPSEKIFKKILPNSFVYHRPKDIVSGDFYWINEKNGKIYVAAVDCTGHGVPGAFMSILGFELFRRITLNEGIDSPDVILNKLTTEFSSFFMDQETLALRDGMDVTFCVIDKEKSIIEFSGAINPLYVIRENKIIEHKGDRFSVSLMMEDNYQFTKKTIHLKKGDMVYLFSDGYADQFGGPEGKKYKYRRFRSLLLNIHKLPMEEQKLFLDESMENWKGRFEQVDDILIIGITADF